MKTCIFLGLVAALVAHPTLCFQLPPHLKDGSYVVKFFDDEARDISIYGREEYMIEQAELAAAYNGTEAEVEAEEDAEDTAVDWGDKGRHNVEKCTGHYISPKDEAIDAWLKLRANCAMNTHPRKPIPRDHNIAIIEKSGGAVAYMCHWGSRTKGNQCMLDELDEVEIMSPCAEGTRLRPGGLGGEIFLVSVRKDYQGPKRGYGYDIDQARHFCRKFWV
ncbi:hypothetical protein F4775DRAFT_607709 [Biscogniauxia sp. FL1348]|nr:hypothetical protein F4775DRAFT_607709 [Biscogniauxia sp. FL1348]